MSGPEPIAVRLRRLRLDRGMSQRELAGPGVSYAYISRIEAGQRRPSVKAIRTLARKLGISAQYLETGSLALDRPEQAANLYERCLEELSRDEDDSDVTARIRFATHLSYALSNLGRFNEARELLTDLTGETQATLDPYSRIRLYWSLARLSTMEGHAQTGLRHLRRAIALLESTEDTLHLARAHLLCAEILILDGQPEAAGFHLERAERLFELGGDARDLGHIRAQDAKRAAQLGNADDA